MASVEEGKKVLSDSSISEVPISFSSSITTPYRPVAPVQVLTDSGQNSDTIKIMGPGALIYSSQTVRATRFARTIIVIRDLKTSSGACLFFSISRIVGNIEECTVSV
ncbi:hypothetical protein CBL_10404 [Carabus blaptoides fortunei]